LPARYPCFALVQYTTALSARPLTVSTASSGFFEHYLVHPPALCGKLLASLSCHPAAQPAGRNASSLVLSVQKVLSGVLVVQQRRPMYFPIWRSLPARPEPDDTFWTDSTFLCSKLTGMFSKRLRTNCCLSILIHSPSVTTFSDEDDIFRRLTWTSRLHYVHTLVLYVTSTS